MKKIVIASGNTGKINDFKAIFKNNEIVGIKEMLPNFNPQETGKTFHDNAVMKAKEAVEKTGFPVISDDSGLSVEVLEGEPGVYSARYAGENATDKENNAKLLNALKEQENRAAYFTSVIAVAFPNGEVKTYTGTVAGTILKNPVGNSGFGYDPLFRTLDGLNFGEISREEKAKVSHRAKAIEKLENDKELFKKL